MNIELKIGIVLNYKNAEKKKDELYCLNSEKWLKIDKIHQPFSIMRKNKKCIPADVAIGVYLESFKDPDVNIIVEYIEKIHYVNLIQSLSIFYDGIHSLSKVIEQRKQMI